jgi:hypothetical protein
MNIALTSVGRDFVMELPMERGTISRPDAGENGEIGAQASPRYAHVRQSMVDARQYFE